MQRPNIQLLRVKACKGAALTNEMFAVLDYIEYLEKALVRAAGLLGVPNEVILNGDLPNRRTNGKEKGK